MKVRYLLFACPLLASTFVGCGGSSDSTVLEPAPVVSPLQEEMETEEYQQGMQNVGK